MRMTRRRVVVTGLGLISPVGNTVAEGWANLLAGRSGIADITQVRCVSNFACRFAGEVKGFKVEDYFPAKDARHMDTFIHYGLAASIQAVRDAGLPTNDAAERRAGRAHRRAGRLGHRRPAADRGRRTPNSTARGPRRISPFFVPASIINMISGHVSITLRLPGPEPGDRHRLHDRPALHRRGRPPDRIRRRRRDDRRRRRSDRLAAGRRRLRRGARAVDAQRRPADRVAPLGQGPRRLRARRRRRRAGARGVRTREARAAPRSTPS